VVQFSHENQQKQKMHACGREIHVTGSIEADIHEPDGEGMGGHRRPRRVFNDTDWGGGTFLQICIVSRLIYIRRKKKKKKNFVLPCSTQHKQRRRRILLPVIRGVKEDVKNLSSTLSTIKAVLEDAENKQGNDPQLKIIDIMKFR
jgi:hypothetical protein